MSPRGSNHGYGTRFPFKEGGAAGSIAGPADRLLAELGGGLLLGLLALLTFAADSAWAKADKQDEKGANAPAAEVVAKGAGRLVRVPLPITGRVDDDVKRAIGRALERLKAAAAGHNGPRPTLILEFTPPPGQNEFGRGSDFARALSLARYLTSRDLANVKTVAYVPRTIKGHAVLVAMACDEIIMAPDAQIGEAGIDENTQAGVEPSVVAGYEQIAAQRKTIHPAIAHGMLDSSQEVLKVETEDGAAYVLQKDLAALRDKKTIQGQPQVLIASGELGKFTGREARDLGLVHLLAGDRMSVARGLDLPAEAMEEDLQVEGQLHGVSVMLSGTIDSRTAETRRRMIEVGLRDKRANMICLWIDSSGGDPEAAAQLASYLVNRPRTEVLTVAYIHHECRGVASLVALACDQIVMQRDARFGGGDRLPTEAELRTLREFLHRDLLLNRHVRSWSLPMALMDPKLTVYQYNNLRNGVQDYFSAAELDEQPDKAVWKQGAPITHDGMALTLTADEAEHYGLVRERGVVDDFAGLKALYGLQNDPALLEPSWVDSLIHLLASPGVSVMLWVIGLAGLYAELHAPGTGVGGFLAAVAFVLFFWVNYLEQTANVFEMVLFLTGITFLILEMFVIPGFGIFGLGGGLMVIASLVLASQTFVVPVNSSQFRELRDSILAVGGTGVGFVAIVMLLRRYLPRSPMFDRMILQPPEGVNALERQRREELVDYRHLLGQRGTVVAQLTPSGKARFGEELVPVMSEGQFITVGSEVVVVDVRGSRVLVEQAG